METSESAHERNPALGVGFKLREFCGVDNVSEVAGDHDQAV